MRFHVVSMPHTQMNDAYCACAFTQKIRAFSTMMTRRGHVVHVYGGVASDADVACAEFVSCQTRAEHERVLGEVRHYTEASFGLTSDWHWTRFNANVVAEIRTRVTPTDVICVLLNRPIYDAFPAHLVVEFGIGYSATFSKYRVWESYAWMHMCYGAAAAGGNPGTVQGAWFDEVIPGFFDPAAFPAPATLVERAERDDYLLFVGRLIDVKGFRIAVDVCKHLGQRLLVVGPATETPPEYGEYLGVLEPAERNRLMSRARALLIPTKYIEPFGNVAVEAQLCGTPVITTDWGGMSETVKHGFSGYRCRSMQQFVDAVRALPALASPSEIRERVVRSHGVAAIGERYDAYFQRLLTLFGKGWYDVQ
jgi:glycosyltransferase involved in cell wall biosynthesis